MNNENDIIVTASDYAKLSSVIAFTGKVSHRVKWELRLLENELKRARIVAPEEVPPDEPVDHPDRDIHRDTPVDAIARWVCGNEVQDLVAKLSRIARCR